MDVFKYVGELGVATILAILLMIAYERLVKQLGDVVANNTEAMTRLVDVTCDSSALLTAHDRRADDMQAALARIEGNLLQVLELVKRERERAAQ
jgi:hypothetical protein